MPKVVSFMHGAGRGFVLQKMLSNPLCFLVDPDYEPYTFIHLYDITDVRILPNNGYSRLWMRIQDEGLTREM